MGPPLCYVLLGCHGLVVALCWLPNIKGLGQLLSFYLVSMHEAKIVCLSIMPQESMQHPGKDHHSLGVPPQLVPDPCHHLE